MKAPRLSLLTLCIVGGLAQGQAIRIDGSTGVAAQTLKGPDYQIDQSLGRLAGANLFHSFQFFSLSPQESATFTTQQAGIAHVISRVTGGAPSLLAGAIRLQAAAGTPALYFINPAGVLFGEGVSLDVPGGFHVSTAANLRMADGSRWESGGGDSFSSAAPEAFGFLGAAAPIVASAASLQAPPGQALQLVAGDISLTDTRLESSGGLRLVATGSQLVDIPLQGDGPAGLSGNIDLSQGSLLRVNTVGSEAAGALRVEAGNLLMQSESGLVTRTLQGSSAAGAAIRLQLSGSLFMQDGSYVESIAGTPAAGGDVLLRSQAASLDGGAYFWTLTLGEGQAGALDLQPTSHLFLSNTANLYSSSYGSGTGGLLRVRTALLSLDSEANLTSDANASGRSGAIDVEASDGLLMNGATVVGLIAGSGGGGDIRLASQGLLLIEGAGSVNVSAAGSGQTGTLSLLAPQLRLTDGASVSHSAVGLGSTGETLIQGSGLLWMDAGAQVVATSEGQRTGAIRLSGGNLLLGPDSFLLNSAQQPGSIAGDLSLSASGLLQLDGATVFNLGLGGGGAGNVSLQAQDLVVGNASRLVSSSSDAGSAAGDLSLSASRSLLINGGATLTTATFSELNAGDLRLSAPTLTLDQANLASSTFGGQGNAGSIQLQASGLLSVRGGSVLQSATSGAGNAGSLLLTGQDIRIDGASLIFASVTEDGSGQGGDIRVQAARQLDLLGGSAIDSSTLGGTRDAGQLLLTAGSALRIENGKLSSAAGEFASGNAGTIHLRSGGTLNLGTQSLVTTATLGAGDAGLIRIEGATLALQGADISSDALEASSGDAGRIELRAQGLLDVGGGSRLSSSTAGPGSAGSLFLQAGDQLLLRGGAQLGAIAFAGSSGQTGDIDLQAGALIRISELSSVEISNFATVDHPQTLQPTLLRLQAPHIELTQALLAASASGNTDASRIEMLAGSDLLITESVVSTTAQDGNGGALLARAGRLLKLKSAGLITSVFGEQGDGGDIDIQAELLFLDGGFIQANTAAANASGGDVRIDTLALVASDNRVVIGGDAPLVFDPLKPLNVIQAAAPNGVSGAVAVANTLDIAGSLALLDRSLLDPGGLGRSPCDRRGGSSLALSGRGGLPPPLLAPLGAPPIAAVPQPLAAALHRGLWGDCR